MQIYFKKQIIIDNGTIPIGSALIIKEVLNCDKILIKVKPFIENNTRKVKKLYVNENFLKTHTTI